MYTWIMEPNLLISLQMLVMTIMKYPLLLWLSKWSSVIELNDD